MGDSCRDKASATASNEVIVAGTAGGQGKFTAVDLIKMTQSNEFGLEGLMNSRRWF